MNVQQQLLINSSTDKLWHILAEEFDQISGWASAVLESGPNPQVPQGEGRVCLTTVGRNTEILTNIDKKNNTFTYEVTPENPPFFLKGITNTWTLVPTEDNQSLVKMDADVHLSSVLGAVMGPLLKRRMLKGFNSILDELKHFAETDTLHARKQTQLNR